MDERSNKDTILFPNPTIAQLLTNASAAQFRAAEFDPNARFQRKLGGEITPLFIKLNQRHDWEDEEVKAILEKGADPDLVIQTPNGECSARQVFV